MRKRSGERKYAPAFKVVGVAVALCVALAACAAGTPAAGGSSAPPGGKPASSSSPKESVTPATVRRTAFAHPTLFPTSTPDAVKPTQQPGTREAPLEITMGSKCVLPGETQSITIRSTPRYHVVFATMWPDNRDHPEWGAYNIPTADTRIGPDGTYSKSWIVPPHAPRGAARTDVSVSGISNNVAYQAQGWAFWEIATAC